MLVTYQFEYKHEANTPDNSIIQCAADTVILRLLHKDTVLSSGDNNHLIQNAA